MTALIETLKNPPTREKSNCGVCKWLANLTPELQQSVREALLDQRWTTRDLTALLREQLELPVKENQLGVHRRGGH